MKVFLVSNMYPSRKDPSSAVFVKNIEENLIERKFEFVARAVIKGRSFNNVIQLLNYFILYIKIIFKGLKYSYDFILAHNISHTTIALYFLCLMRNTTIVFNIHGTDLKSNNIVNRISRRVVDLMIKRGNVKSIIVPSDYFKDIVSRRFDIADKAIIISPSGGFDGEVFYVHEGQKKLIGNIDVFTLGYVSRIEEKKGWRLFLNLIKRLNESNIRCRGIIAGKGPDEDELKDQIIKLKLQSKIDFLGVVKQAELANIYNKIDAFIFPTLYEESLGLVGIEAMACGTIVIGSDNGGIKSYVQQGENGYLFETGNFEELFRKTLVFYNLPDINKVKLYFSAVKTAKQFEKGNVKRMLSQKIESLYEKE